MFEDEYPNDDSYDDVMDAIEDDEPNDDILERQEMEDFEQTDEYFGYYGDCDVD